MFLVMLQPNVPHLVHAQILIFSATSMVKLLILRLLWSWEQGE